MRARSFTLLVAIERILKFEHFFNTAQLKQYLKWYAHSRY
jgi:hypothetical protein